ncbi:MAG: hypothetical protein R3F11_05350 [Verrucomicrobiales bacterium]
MDAAAVHAWDRKLDLAILKLPGGRKLPPLDLGDSAKPRRARKSSPSWQSARL